MTTTPICCECGRLPIADLEFARLTSRVAELEATLADRLTIDKALADQTNKTIKKQTERIAELEAKVKDLEEGCHQIGRWMSAALEDESVCLAMKSDIERFFELTSTAHADATDAGDKQEGRE